MLTALLLAAAPISALPIGKDKPESVSSLENHRLKQKEICQYFWIDDVPMQRKCLSDSVTGYIIFNALLEGSNPELEFDLRKCLARFGDDKVFGWYNVGECANFQYDAYWKGYPPPF